MLPVFVEQVNGVHYLAIDVELILVVGTVPDEDRFRVSIAAQVIEFDFVGYYLTVDRVDRA